MGQYGILGGSQAIARQSIVHLGAEGLLRPFKQKSHLIFQVAVESGFFHFLNPILIIRLPTYISMLI
jgi:hypothetical protein